MHHDETLDRSHESSQNIETSEERNLQLTHMNGDIRYNESGYNDVHKHHHGVDAVDLGNFTRVLGDITTGKALALDNFIALVSISTFLSDIVTDCLVAVKYYEHKDWWWFSLTVSFIVIPSVVMQMVSYQWYVDDNVDQQWWETAVHIFQVGPVKR